MLALRLLNKAHAAQAADLHRRAGALIPGYETSLHSAAEFVIFYRERVLVSGPVWGMFDGDLLRGHMALLPGWIDHLYVDPNCHRRGIGSALVRLAQAEQDELQLYTFQSKVRARAFYEQHGFIIQELTNGERNEEKLPDMTYRWSR